MTLIYAHRGASVAAPENTLEAFGLAVELGADGVELDVRRTLDDRLVVHHDAALGDGRVIRWTAASDLPGHVPLLADALDACGDLIVNIEIKNDPDDPDHDPADWVAIRLAAELATRPHPARWLLSSFRSETAARCRTLLPASRTAWLTVDAGAHEMAGAAAGGHDAIHPHADRLDPGALRAAHAAGLAVNVWVCNDPGRLTELIRWGVDGICTDVPDVALAIRGR